MIEILKIIFLFLMAWQLPIIIIKAVYKQGITWLQFITLASGITGFTYLMFLL